MSEPTPEERADKFFAEGKLCPKTGDWIRGRPGRTAVVEVIREAIEAEQKRCAGIALRVARHYERRANQSKRSFPSEHGHVNLRFMAKAAQEVRAAIHGTASEEPEQLTSPDTREE